MEHTPEEKAKNLSDEQLLDAVVNMDLRLCVPADPDRDHSILINELVRRYIQAVNTAESFVHKWNERLATAAYPNVKFVDAK